MNILYNIIWCILCYLIGSINFSIILTKFSSSKKNIKEIGSGNAGATNAMRAYGFKFGLLVFFLDTSKSFWIGFIMGLLQSKTEAFSALLPQVCLLFVIIGHIFPIYFKFKGGKGAASFLGMLASISIFLAMIGTVIFVAIVWKTKYVSLGSITVPYILAALAFLIPFFKHMDTVIICGQFWLSPVCLFAASIIVATSHWQNIIRLINGNESKFSFKSNKIKEEVSSNSNDKNQNNTSKNSTIDDATSLNKFN